MAYFVLFPGCVVYYRLLIMPGDSRDTTIHFTFLIYRAILFFSSSERTQKILYCIVHFVYFSFFLTDLIFFSCVFKMNMIIKVISDKMLMQISSQMFVHFFFFFVIYACEWQMFGNNISNFEQNYMFLKHVINTRSSLQMHLISVRFYEMGDIHITTNTVYTNFNPYQNWWIVFINRWSIYFNSCKFFLFLLKFASHAKINCLVTL